MNTPLMEAVKAYLKKDIFPFHTPGHKGLWPLHELQAPNDLGRADIADDVGPFPEAFARTLEAAAWTYGTKNTYFLTNGATAGVHASFQAILKPGDKVILGRNFHMSVIQSLISLGLHPVYIPVEFDADGIPLNVTPEKVISTIKANTDAKLVFLTSPSYFCVCTDVTEIAAAAHQHDMPLVMDEAWGAHLPFGEAFPLSTLRQGADLVIHGAHKTLPTFTGTALLHRNSARIDEELLEESLAMVETTSPNTLMYLSLEQAIHTMYHEGKVTLKNAADACRRAKEKLKRETFFEYGYPEDKLSRKELFQFDPIKLLLRTNYQNTGITGMEVAEFLTENHGIVPEMADLQTVLFIFTGFEEEAGDGFLVYGIRHAAIELAKKHGVTPAETNKTSLPTGNLPIPEQIIPPREAFFAPGETLPLENCTGKIIKRPITPYPPGIPTLIPGEQAAPEHIQYLTQLYKAGGNIRGIRLQNGEPTAEVVKNP